MGGIFLFMKRHTGDVGFPKHEHPKDVGLRAKGHLKDVALLDQRTCTGCRVSSWADIRMM